MFNPAMDNGASVVAYRGWAYGTAGWEPPHYTVDEIPSLQNGAMTPVVMSFVCLNGDFSAADACFGEVFTRQGSSSPESFRGAVAFIGNGEHWSHTRFNDAMAISTFEKIILPEITDLGGLMNASKVRFYDYFPHEVDAETFGEESVEFYFHIYNLLGDPAVPVAAPLHDLVVQVAAENQPALVGLRDVEMPHPVRDHVVDAGFQPLGDKGLKDVGLNG